jgi:hypothetical protein
MSPHEPSKTVYTGFSSLGRVFAPPSDFSPETALLAVEGFLRTTRFGEAAFISSASFFSIKLRTSCGT